MVSPKQFEDAINTILETAPPKEDWRKYESRVNMQLKAVAVIYQMPPHLLRKEDAALIAGSLNPDARVRQALIPLLVRAGTELALQRVKGMQVDEDAGVRAAAQNALKTYESKVEFKKAA